MSSMDAGRLLPPVSKREWALSSVRPVTLLIASGIILVTAILIVTGVVAGQLREQAVATTQSALAQLDAVLAEAGGRSMRAVDQALGEIARRAVPLEAVAPADTTAALAGPAAATLLQGKVDTVPQIAALVLADPNGTVLNRAGEWPSGESSIAARDYFRALRARPGNEAVIGAPSADAASVFLARPLLGPHGDLIGVVAAAIRPGEFDGFYRDIPLGADGIVALVRRDGVVLARYPADPGALGQPIADPRLKAMLADSSKAVIDVAGDGGSWRIGSLHALGDYPAAVVISRGGTEALDDWSRQALLFGAFAACGALAIGAMVYLIARQFRSHSALAAMRAAKIESEHARLVAEAELLKKERLSVLGQLTATVAHELRNPLSAIRNTLFTLKEMAKGSGMKLDRPVARMERSIERCDRIIGDLLEYARNRDLRRAEIAFDRWLGEILAEHALPQTVTLTRELGAREGVVSIDAERIRRVIINLIDNAAQALGERQGGGEARITVRTALAGDWLEFVVADTGPGIPPENLARIFEPLFSTKSFGTGLGLATVRQIVAQHGGRIDVRSEVGQGTAFSVRLPLHPELEVMA